MPQILTAWAHDPADNSVYMDPGLISGAREGDIAELWLPKEFNTSDAPLSASRHYAGEVAQSSANNKFSAGSTETRKDLGNERKNLYFQIKKPRTATSAKLGSPIVSVSSAALNTLGIRPRSQVAIKLLRSEEQCRRVRLDVVEIHFKGVNLTRSDHYKIAKSISKTCVSCGQKVGYLDDSVRVTIESLYRDGKRKFSGYISEDTRLVFRSDSARILIFIQMSSEMWNFDECGDIMFHRLVNSFIPEMLHRWHTQGDWHLVSIVLFTSVSARSSRSNHVLRAGMLEKDTYHFYRVVVDSVHISRWSDIMRTLRAEFERFPQEVLEDPETHELLGEFLPSSKSNILEAFSLATTLLTSKFVDRDICRTGVQAMVATAGPACFDVDLSELWNLSRRLLGVEIGIELVCLARPPLHVTPLFQALLPASESDLTGQEYFLGFGNWKRPPKSRLVHCVPTWINMSFWGAPDKYMKQWIPRCRIYDLQMVGLIESESRCLGMKSFQFDANELTHEFMRSFDSGVFKSVEMIESQKRVEIAAKSANSSELRPRAQALDQLTPATAITTAAVAQPMIANSTSGGASSLQSGNAEAAKTDLRPKHKQSRDSLRSYNQDGRASKIAGAARFSLGALLGIKSGSKNLDKGKASNSSTTPIPLPQAPSGQVSGSQSPAQSATNSRSIEDDDPATERLVVKATPAKAIQTRKSTQSPNNFQYPALSVQRETPTTSSLVASYQGKAPKTLVSGLSPIREKSLNAGMSLSPGLDANAGSMTLSTGPKAFCDTSRPEFQNPAMWRVLLNSATIDEPSHVEAYGRWANVYPPKKRLTSVSWHSLKSPASLPLTCESFPTLNSFHEHYKFQFYDVAVDDDVPMQVLLDEMIGLRLQLGFQIAVGAAVRAVEASLPTGIPNNIVSVIPKDPKSCQRLRIYMTRMGLVHRLAVDDDLAVNVRLYTWIDRNAQWLKSPLNEGRKEEVKVKSRYEKSYRNISNKFLDQGLEHLNWSMLDLQLSGADDPLLYPSSANTQNLVAIRYVLIPVNAAHVPGLDTLTAEEGHVEGITRIVRQLLRHREAGSIDSDFIVHYYTGKLSQSIAEIVQESSSKLEMNRLNKRISLENLAHEMKGAMGLKFSDRRWHWKQFRQVFLGHDFVVWLTKTFDDINTTEEAECYGAELMKRGFIRHPEGRHPFIQGHYFYELTPDYGDHCDTCAGSGQKGKTDSEKDSRQTSKIPPTSAAKETNSTTPDGRHRATVHFSESFIINVDPKGMTGRPERVKVSIDRMHNPKNAFHILVEWLSITPRLVDDLFNSAGRVASQYGLRLVQAPVADVAGSLEDSPFRSAMWVKLSIELKDPEERRWFIHYLLRRNGYVLDVYDRRDICSDEFEVQFFWGRLRSASAQYIHQSGFVLVQVEADGTLCITANTLHLSRAVLAGNSAAALADSECESKMQELYRLCHDREHLLKLADEGWKQRKQARVITSKSLLKGREQSEDTQKG